MDSSSGSSGNNRIQFLEWIYFTPPAIQMVAHFFTGFLIPGIIGAFLQYWQVLTRSIWGNLAALFSFHIDGLESIYDLYSLGFFMLFIAIRVKYRKAIDKTDPIKVEFTSANFFQKQIIVVRMAGLAMAFNIIFSIKNAKECFGTWIGVMIFYIFSLIFLIIAIELYLGIPYENLEKLIEAKRITKRYTFVYLWTWPGLILLVIPFVLILWFSLEVYQISSLAPIFIGELSLGMGVIFLLLAGWSHFKFGRPSTRTVILSSMAFINGVLLFEFMTFPGIVSYYSHIVYARVVFSTQENIVTCLFIIGSVFSTLSLLYMLKTNWKVARNILLLFLSFMSSILIAKSIEQALKNL